MIAFADKVFCTALFERQIKSLRRSDKRGAAALVRAEELMSAIASGQRSNEEIVTKQTKHGELRLKNCKKYDLGSGYRLISLREGDSLYFAYIGTHDACNRWLNKRRTTGMRLNLERIKPIRYEIAPVEEQGLPAELLQADAEYEAYIASKLDNATIRHLFRGLRGETSV